MVVTSAEDLHELVAQLPVRERLRLVERIARDLAAALPAPSQPFDWTRLAGCAPGLLDGQDAQVEVSDSRRAADDARAIRRGERTGQ